MYSPTDREISAGTLVNRLIDHQRSDWQFDRDIADGCSDYDRSNVTATLLEKMSWRAVHQTDRLAYRFLSDQSLPVALSASVTWTYGELYERVQAIADELAGQHKHLIGQPVLLVYSPGLELIAAFLACLSAGAIPTLVPSPRRHESLSRWQHIMADANVAAVLTSQDLQEQIEPLLVRYRQSKAQDVKTQDEKAQDTAAASVFSIATDAINCSTRSTNGVADVTQPPRENIAFLQYTSGSTSQPKGVMVTHANLAHNLEQIQLAFGYSDSNQGVIWLPPYHDMGLIGGILQPLYSGYPVTLMSPTSFLRQPSRWLEAIAHFKGTISGGPNFAYDYCLQKVSVEQCQSLDLSSWSVAFTGAESIRAQTLRCFSEKFVACGFDHNAFYPCYGLAESTLFVTGKTAIAPEVISVSRSKLNQGEVQTVSEIDGETAASEIQQNDVRQIVSCGRSIRQPIETPRIETPRTETQRIEIVDPQTGVPCKPGSIGEIWVCGPSVAAGYWNQKQTTEAVFRNALGQATEKSGAKKFMRTGDLGFIRSGELFVTGRLKDLIVIRGQNYYPQDIELSIAQAHSGLQPASAVFSLSAEEVLSEVQTEAQIEVQAGSEQLIVVQEVSRSAVRQIRKQMLSASEIVEAIRACVSQQHGLQVWAVALLKPGQLPKTTSGKVQRQLCKARFQANELEAIGAWQQPQEKMAKEKTADEKTANAVSKSADHLIEWLRDYARDSINSRVMDERRCISPSVVLDFGNKGLLGMQVPRQYGGLGLDNRSMLRVIEQIGAIDPTLALFVGLNNVLGIRPILNYAQRELKEALLPKLASGRELAAFALTESGAGSHPLGMSAKALPTATGWQITGEKVWSGSAAWAGVINVFAQQMDAAGNPVGVSAFVVEKGTPGLKQGPEALTMGMRGMVQNAVLLQDVPVADDQRLGAAGKGMIVAQDAMMYGRLAIAAACVGGMKRCAQLMLRYSQRRTISTGKLLDNPVTMTRLNWLAGAIAATESLVTLIATRLDSEQFVPEELYAACKIAAPEFYWQAADHLVQCLGGRGYIEPNIAPQILRDARVLRIFEGPTESLAMYLGSRVINHPQSLQALFEELSVSDPSIVETSSLLFESANWILSYYFSEKSPFFQAESDKQTRRQTALRQAHFKVGEISSWAILLVALKAAAASSDAIAWCQTTFDQAVKRALEPQPDESDKITEIVANIEHYQQSIGVVEQMLAAADEVIDRLLQKDNGPSSEQQGVDTVKDNQASHAYRDQAISHRRSQARTFSAIGTHRRERAVENWIVQWLSERLDIAVGSIEPSKAFADYGLDSVMAVELAQDLSDFFSIPEPLEATLAWNFPTIRALSGHLAIMLAQQEIGLPEKDDSIEDSPIEDIFIEDSAKESLEIPEKTASEAPIEPLDDLSEDEVASALLAELATVRGR